MNQVNSKADQAIQQANLALKKGDKGTARRLAEKAISCNPHREEPWLILAAIGTPRASIAYLKKALEINPTSNYARQGMHWAIRRLRADRPPRKIPRQLITTHIRPDSFTESRPAFLPWVLILSLAITGVLLWFSTPTLSFAFNTGNVIQLAEAGIQKSTYTLTPTSTYTPTPTFTPSPTATSSPTPTPTPSSTFTSTPVPTNPKKAADNTNSSVILPPGVKKGEFWIEVDLSRQRLYAYKGKNLLESFVASTGTWRYPTITGNYNIYVKYRYAPMSGPGYYLPNVPYVMYFYKGYGVHGTYWHNNFGTPMSHGCINLRTEDAGWVYNRASIGTVVNIHH